MNVEYTDRYGGRQPSWLRGCHGQCEATGVVPVFWYPNNWTDRICAPGETYMPREEDETLIEAWCHAHADLGAADPAHTDSSCDGTHFVRCPDCQGSGRVSWWVSIARVPGWLVKGIRFQKLAFQPEVHPPEWGFARRLKTTLWAAFWCDIVSLRR